jgi:hypothetical protein
MGEGELLLQLATTGDKHQNAEFKEKLLVSIGEKADVRYLTQWSQVEIKDIDEVTTAEDVQAALEYKFQTKDIVVKSLRKAYRGTQTAVITLPAALAVKLIDESKIRIGWVVCKIRAVVFPLKCFKCCGYGHQISNCRGKDRSKLCYRCGQKGHKMGTCSNDPKCPICGEEDNAGDTNHTAGSYKCPAYQKALRSTKQCA